LVKNGEQGIDEQRFPANQVGLRDDRLVQRPEFESCPTTGLGSLVGSLSAVFGQVSERASKIDNAPAAIAQGKEGRRGPDQLVVCMWCQMQRYQLWHT
jgi:hypothetical protein